MTFWTSDNLRAACAGTWLLRPPPIGSTAERPITGLSTDSRFLSPGQAFLALRGERFDGHHYLADAVAAGSPLLVVDTATVAEPLMRQARDAGIGIVRVGDTGKALMRLAGAYRRTLEKTKVIGVVGSNGKTTTTRLINAVLGSSLRGTASAKSFNNAIGVPLTILSASPSDQYLICEIGSNAPGEVAPLADVVEPDIAVITSIGREHLEGFGTLQGVAREEASILQFLRPGGFAVVTADTPAQAPLTEYLKSLSNVVTFGACRNADLRASDVSHVVASTSGEGTFGLRFRINERMECSLPMIGGHNASNALAAFAVGRRFGLDPERIIAALGAAGGPPMRLQPVVIPSGAGREPIRIINDAYNANPDSMLAALETLLQVASSAPASAGRVVVVLGDMMELGAAAEASHREIAERVREMHTIDLVALVGEQMDRWARPVLVAPGNVRPVASEPVAEERALDRLASLIRPGDLVLLKGSRRIMLERLVEALRARATTEVLPSGAPCTA